MGTAKSSIFFSARSKAPSQQRFAFSAKQKKAGYQSQIVHFGNGTLAGNLILVSICVELFILLKAAPSNFDPEMKYISKKIPVLPTKKFPKPDNYNA